MGRGRESQGRKTKRTKGGGGEGGELRARPGRGVFSPQSETLPISEDVFKRSPALQNNVQRECNGEATANTYLHYL